MRILYLHGLASSKLANTCQVLRDNLVNDEILSIDIPMNPKEAMNKIMKTIYEFHPSLIIGNSLGGFYATFFEGPWKILINPALRPNVEITKILGGYGKFSYLKEREDGSNTFIYDKEDEKEFEHYVKLFKESIIDFDVISQTYALFGSEDDIVNDKEYFDTLFDSSHSSMMHCGHRITNDNILNDIIPLIEKLRNH